MGCTYLQKCFSRITVWDVHTYGNDWVWMPRPIAHGPSLCPWRANPRRFLDRVGRTPYRPHSLDDGSKCRRRKGLKTVCLARRFTSGSIPNPSGSTTVDIFDGPATDLLCHIVKDLRSLYAVEPILSFLKDTFYDGGLGPSIAKSDLMDHAHDEGTHNGSSKVK